MMRKDFVDDVVDQIYASLGSNQSTFGQNFAAAWRDLGRYLPDIAHDIRRAIVENRRQLLNVFLNTDSINVEELRFNNKQ